MMRAILQRHIQPLTTHSGALVAIGHAMLFTLITIAPATAQVRPDAGQVLRALERPDATPALPTTPSTPLLPMLSIPDNNTIRNTNKNTEQNTKQATISNTDDTKIAVNTLFVSGASVFARGQLDALLYQWSRRTLSLAELEQAAARITRHYHEHGYPLARAYLPAQTIKDGVVEIAVLEGHIGQVTINNASRVSDWQVQTLLGRIKAGDPVYPQALDVSLIALNDIPGIGAVHAALRSGASLGLSDVLVSIQPGPFASGTVDIANHGNRYTGSYLFGASLNLNSPLQLGDQVSLRFQTSDSHLLYRRFAYRLPLGANGLRVGSAWSSSRYRLGEAYADLHANGEASIASIFVSHSINHPALRAHGLHINAALVTENKFLQDRIDTLGTEVDKHIRLATLGLDGDGQNATGDSHFSLAYTIGKLRINSLEANALDATTAKTDGQYRTARYAASARFPLFGLARSWSLLASVNGQWASKNLDSSEKFSLGGADGVRAYRQGEASANEGQIWLAQLAYTLPSTRYGNTEIKGFIDHGRVKINRHPFVAGENRRSLSAVGLGIDWAMPGAALAASPTLPISSSSWISPILLKASLAWKIGDGGNGNGSGDDSDGRVRFWMQVIKYF